MLDLQQNSMIITIRNVDTTSTRTWSRVESVCVFFLSFRRLSRGKLPAQYPFKKAKVNEKKKTPVFLRLLQPPMPSSLTAQGGPCVVSGLLIA